MQGGHSKVASTMAVSRSTIIAAVNVIATYFAFR